MEINRVIDKIKEFLELLIDKIAINNPLLGFTKPIITRILDNNTHKISKTLSLLADEDGNIDVLGILDDMIVLFNNTKQFTINTSFIGDIKLGEGKIIINIPFTGKDIVFNLNDLEALRNTLINS